ncbi:MAG: carboxypeptidase regulatory-like domain-containing protein [Woeseiaceae bacterium]|nr:carboxypeptidase regulatory-like domain-containing protein [Woeseiaceae bacterium]
MSIHWIRSAALAVCLVLAACGGGDDAATDSAGDDAGAAPPQGQISEELPSSLGLGEYNRLRDAIDDDEVPLRVVPRLNPSDRLDFADVEDASRALNEAIEDGDFQKADRIFASVAPRWRDELINRGHDGAADAYGAGNYAGTYRFDRYLNLDTRAFWILDAEYIRGRVSDTGSGAPVQGATVSYTESSYPQTVQTNADGEFRILLPADRPSGLAFEHPEYGIKRVFNTSAGGPISPTALGGETLEIRLGTGYPKLTFRGRFVDAATGNPLASFPVMAGFDPIDGATELNLQLAMGEFGRETDAEGRVEITGLPVNSIHVIAQGPYDGQLYVFRQENLSFEDGVEQVIEVSGGKVKLDIPLTVAGTVLDRVTGAPIQNARVSAGGWKAENTDVNGRFMIQLDTGKDWQLTATHKAYHSSQPKPFASADAAIVETEFLLDPITTGTILGTAINAATGEPIANAVIEIAGQQIRTDSSGRFRAEEIESGEVRVSAAQSGYRSDSEALLLEALQTAEATLELEPITTGTITGLVVDDTSQAPLPGVAVGAGDRSTTTGDDGRFVLEEVEAGVLEVAASKRLYVPGSSDVELEAMATVETRIALTPITWGSVRGTVRDAVTGEALPGTTVNIGAIEIRTGDNGEFAAEKVPAGTVSVVAKRSRYHDAEASFELPLDGNAEQDLEMSPITTGTVLVVVEDASSGAAIPGAEIMLGSRRMTTDAEGRVVATEVPAGEVSVNATANLYEPGSGEVALEAAGEASVAIELIPITYGTIYGKVVDKSSGEPVGSASVRIGGREVRSDQQGEFRAERIPAGSVPVSAELLRYRGDQQTVALERGTEREVRLQLEPITTGTVRGVVRNATNGNAVAGASVVIGGLSARTSSDGRFEIEQVGAGVVDARASARLYEPGESAVTVEAAGTVETVIEMVPITYGTVSGTVVDAESGQPLADAQVVAGRQSARTDSSGRFELQRVTAGEVSVSASKSVYINNGLTISLAAGESETVRLRLEPITWGTITGIASDADTGRPLPNAEIVVGTQALRSDANGRFRAEKVTAGRVSVAGKYAAYEPNSVAVELAPDSERDVALQLTPIKIGDISGRVIDAKTGEPIAQARVTVGRSAAETKADGAFRFSDVSTGRTAVAARHPDYADGSASAEVLPADTVDITIRLDLRREDVTSLESELAKSGTIDLYGIYFDSGRAQFKPSSLSTLRAVLEVMKRAPDRRFRIAGHTDTDGADDYNQDLSERRATTVIEWLVDNGIDAARLDGVGFGEARPAAPNDTESGKALNRRVQLSYAD